MKLSTYFIFIHSVFIVLFYKFYISFTFFWWHSDYVFISNLFCICLKINYFSIFLLKILAYSPFFALFYYILFSYILQIYDFFEHYVYLLNYFFVIFIHFCQLWILWITLWITENAIFPFTSCSHYKFCLFILYFFNNLFLKIMCTNIVWKQKNRKRTLKLLLFLGIFRTKFAKFVYDY